MSAAPEEAQPGNGQNGESRGPKGKIQHPFPQLRAKLKETHLYDVKIKAVHLKSKIGKFKNLINPNHRHDEEHEQKTDEKRSRICENHRFNSFAPERDGNLVKWYVDGRDYFWAVAEMLDRATETIYIADWWLSPELYLKRPPFYNQEWRLDHILKRKAEQGVKIYVCVYKEVSRLKPAADLPFTCVAPPSKHMLICFLGVCGVDLQQPTHQESSNEPHQGR